MSAISSATDEEMKGKRLSQLMCFANFRVADREVLCPSRVTIFEINLEIECLRSKLAPQRRRSLNFRPAEADALRLGDPEVGGTGQDRHWLCELDPRRQVSLFRLRVWVGPGDFSLRMADRKLERVTGLKDLRRVESSLYQWSGLTPDGAPLLLRDIGTQEVYALDFEEP